MPTSNYHKLWQALYLITASALLSVVYLCQVESASDAQGGIVWIVGGPIVAALDLLLVRLTYLLAHGRVVISQRLLLHSGTIVFILSHWFFGAPVALGIFQYVYGKTPMRYSHDFRQPQAEVELGDGGQVAYAQDRFRLLSCDVTQARPGIYQMGLGGNYARFSIRFNNASQNIKYVNWLSNYTQQGPRRPVAPGDTLELLQEGAVAQVVRDAQGRCELVIGLQ